MKLKLGFGLLKANPSKTKQGSQFDSYHSSLVDPVICYYPEKLLRKNVEKTIADNELWELTNSTRLGDQENTDFIGKVAEQC